MAKAPGKKRAQPETERFIVRVDNWDWYLSYGYSGVKWERGAIRQLTTLTFRGTLYRPERARYPRAEVTFSERDDDIVQSPDCIGSISMAGDQLHAYMCTASGTFGQLRTMAPAVRAIVMTGKPLFRRKATFRSISVLTAFNSADW